MTAQRFTATHDITTTSAEVGYVIDGAIAPPGSWVVDHLPKRPTVLGAWTLAQICSVRLAPSQSLYTTVQRIPPAAKARFGADGAVIEPNFEVEAQRVSDQPRQSAMSAIGAWVHDLPADSRFVDTGTLSAAAVVGAAACGSRPLAIVPGDPAIDTVTVATDRAGLPMLPGRSTSLRAECNHPGGVTVVADGLQAIFALGREELPGLLDTLPKRSRLGAEVAMRSGRRSLADRLWKRDDDTAHDHQSTGREMILLPPWDAGDAQEMIHTAALASNGAWANWFDGAEARIGRVFWALTDPDCDDHLLRPQTAAAIRDPRILAAALLQHPKERAAVRGGRLIDLAPLRGLAQDRRYVVDQDAWSRRVAADWVQRNRERIPLMLRNGWMAARDWLDPAGLDDVLSNPFARTELALPIARTVALDAWLSTLDPEVE